MITLAVDTVSSAGGVALLGACDSPLTKELGDRGRHAEEIVPASLALLEEAGVSWNDVGLLAVDEGPGSFTGIRVGVAFVLGLAEARGLPAAGVGCLDILARACYDATSPKTGGYIVSVADVRRGEVVLARFRATETGPVREGDEVLTPVTDAGEPPPPGSVVTGDGGDLLWLEAPGITRWIGNGSDRAVACALLGMAAHRVRELPTPAPRYARPADARPRQG
jgi:tRNA threonylcarbamoyladenosine biosynthesis protein TsaB